MKSILIALVLTLATQLTACIGVAVNSASLAAQAAPRDELLPLAEAGDPAAQYELGKSYCCMGVGFSMQTATQWLCRAARQGNADAMFELGRIYLGDVSRSFAPGQMLRGALMAKEFPALAHAWLSIAATTDFPDASELLADLETDISDEDRERSTELRQNWREIPCDYESVLSQFEV